MASRSFGPALLRWLCLACVWLGISGVALAQVPAESDNAAWRARAAEVGVPDALLPWVPWVMLGQKQWACPVARNESLCLWPGVLQLDLQSQGGTFAFEVRADTTTLVLLPGRAGMWPAGVTVNGAPAVVGSGREYPWVEVPAGVHTIAGTFGWERLPESLPLHPAVALVTLKIDGVAVPRVRREGDGGIWLRAEEQVEQPEENALNLEVWRRLSDTIPARLETRIRLRVSGQAREMSLGPVLPAGFVAHQLGADLPARVEPDGTLTVQVRAGDWQLVVDAHRSTPVAELAFTSELAEWPERETWVFEAQPSLRTVSVGGVPGVDPQRTSLPSEWHHLPAFLVAEGAALVLEETRRGESEPPPDSLAVSRTLWLSLDGTRLTAQDALSGSLSVGGRLAALEPGELGRVEVAGQGRVITTMDGLPGAGVEVREGQVQVSGRLQYEAAAPVPAVGWNRDAQSLYVTLNLPPGWTLLTASGPDDVQGSWIRQWSLLDLFVLLLAVLAIRHMAGNAVGAGALVILGLSWHEPGAMRLLWLALVVVWALSQRLQKGFLAGLLRPTRWGLAVIMMVMAVMFCAVQSQHALYPHLASPWGGGSPMNGVFDGGMVMDQTTAPMAPPAVEPMPSAADIPTGATVTGEFEALEQAGMPGNGDGLEDSEVREYMVVPERGGRYDEDLRNQRLLGGSLSSSVDTRSSQFDPAETVQTGPGLPQWSWRSASFSWNGPVSQEAEVKLVLLPPFVNTLLGLLRALGVVALTLWLVRSLVTSGGSPSAPASSDAPGSAPDPAAGTASPTASMAGAASVSTAVVFGTAALLVAFMTASAPAQAQMMPGSDVLDQMRQRLAPRSCEGECSTIASTTLVAQGGALALTLEVHAQRDTDVVLPGPDSVWAPTAVMVDGVPEVAMFRDGQGHVHVRVPAGIRRIVASGPAPERLSLYFPQATQMLAVESEGWTVAGWRVGEPPPSTIELTRVAVVPTEGSSLEAPAPETLPAWVTLQRTLDLGIPWAVHHELTRQGPTGSAVLLRVPLMPGESVTSPGIQVEQGVALISMGAQESVVRWESTLAEAPELTLVAPTDVAWTETWVLLCSPIWHCEHEGLAPVRHMDLTAPGGLWAPVWQPWPGEQVVVRLTRPTPAPGATTTVQSANVQVSGGSSLRDASLTLVLTSSQGGDQQVTLPAAARLQEFSIDGAVVPATLAEGALAYRVGPGQHTIFVRWREDHQQGFVDRTPAVLVAGGASNITLQYTVPDNRWLLWTGGPAWGPVVTLWQYLLAVAVGAALLAKFVPVPMGFGAWLLLGLGTSQTHPMALLIVVGWLVLVGVRGRWTDLSPSRHNLLQLTIGVWTFPAFVALLLAIEKGLRLYPPDMGVRGGESWGSTLQWYTDVAPEALPQGWMVSLPLWWWHVGMLLWALWVAWRTLGWARWAWAQLGQGGVWKRFPVPVRPMPPAGGGPAPAPASGWAAPVLADAPAEGQATAPAPAPTAVVLLKDSPAEGAPTAPAPTAAGETGGEP